MEGVLFVVFGFFAAMILAVFGKPLENPPMSMHLNIGLRGLVGTGACGTCVRGERWVSVLPGVLR